MMMLNCDDINDGRWKIMSKAKSYTAPCQGWTSYASFNMPHNMHCTVLLLCNTLNDFNHKRIAKFSFCSKMNWKMCQDSFKMFQFCTSLPLLQCQHHFSAKWFLAWSLKHSKQRGWKQTSAKNILWSSNATAGSLPVMNAPITVTFKEPPCDGGRCDLTNKRQRQMHPTNDQQKDLMHPITNNCYI